MKHKLSSWVFAYALGMLMLAGGLRADERNPDAGRSLVKMCRTCHGIDGLAKIPIAPHIGGETADYLADQLSAFRDGRRIHEMMNVVAKTLSNRQIIDVSAWYASQKVRAKLAPGIDPNLAPKTCVMCHGIDGIAQAEDVPYLAGESVLYIETQLKAFRSSKRESEVMSEIAHKMSDQEIRAAAKWYSAIEVEIEKPE